MLEAGYSPVRRCRYAGERARVAQRTDLDRLILDVDTNGGIEPAEAVRLAARILRDQLSVFVDLEAEAAQAAAVPGKKELRSEEHTSELQSLMRISYAVFCLKKNNYHTKTARRDIT